MLPQISSQILVTNVKFFAVSMADFEAAFNTTWSTINNKREQISTNRIRIS